MKLTLNDMQIHPQETDERPADRTVLGYYWNDTYGCYLATPIFRGVANWLNMRSKLIVVPDYSGWVELHDLNQFVDLPVTNVELEPYWWSRHKPEVQRTGDKCSYAVVVNGETLTDTICKTPEQAAEIYNTVARMRRENET